VRPISAISQQIWDMKYRLKQDGGTPVDRTLEDTWHRIANALAETEADADRTAWGERFFTALEDFKFLPAGRIVAGAGTGRQVTLFNCFVMGAIPDDMAGIFSHLKEAALTMQQGGGIGYDFSTLRPKGAPVKGVGADASGPLSFMDVWDAMCRTIMSAGYRRGAMMATLACDHPDIEAFIEAKREPGRLRMFNLSVLVSDAFMTAVKEDAPWELKFNGTSFKTVRARDLWDRIMRATYAFAEPGVIFIDRINKKNNLHYCETIRATNPCVTGDTRLHTQYGIVRVDQLYASQAAITATVDNRALAADQRGVSMRSAVPVFMTAQEADIYRVETEDGYEIKATEWHDFYTERGKVKLKDLQPGDRLLVQSGKGQFGDQGTRELGLLIGLITGDGHFTNRGHGEQAAIVNFWGDDRPLATLVAQIINAMIAGLAQSGRDYRVSPVAVPDRNHLFLRSVLLARVLEHYGFTAATKHRVPEVVWRGNEECVKAYLQGLFQTDGTVNVSSNSQSCSVRLASSQPSLLKDVQILLANFGIFCRIRHRRAAGERMLPDGKGGARTYSCQADYELIIDGESRERFMDEIGFLGEAKAQRYRGWVAGKVLRKTQAFATKVTAVRHVGREPVYDTTQADHNTVIFNGLVTGQCGEQPLPPYGACLLGSINVAALIKDPFTPEARLDEAEFDRLVPLAVRMMDNTIDVSRFPLEEQQAEAKAKRRIGLGVTGLADALIMCRVRYGSEAAVRLTETWMRRLERQAYLASVEIAKEKGPFPLFEAAPFLAGETVGALDKDIKEGIAAHGIRNALLTSIAPTGTISLLADNVSSGLEPVFSFSYTRNVLMPDGTRRTEEVSDYAYRMYRRLYGETAELPDYFVDAQRLSPSDHVVMQAACQKYVDASISKTINCPEDITFEAFKDVYLQSYELGCKGCTTYRPNDVTGAVLAVKEAVAKQSAARPVQQALPLGRPPARPADPFEAGAVVYMTQPLDRPEALPGQTYKVKWPDSEHAIYITINDVVMDGRRRPFEVFINSKNMEHYAWTVALTRMISAVFRRGGDVSFVVDELKAVFDPRGGQWMGGRYVPSLLAAIGEVIERHMIVIGFLAVPGRPHADPALSQPLLATSASSEPAQISEMPQTGAGSGASTAAGGRVSPFLRQCPKCGSPSLIRQEGCDTCTSCDYSKCA